MGSGRCARTAAGGNHEREAMTIPELRLRLRPAWPALDVHVHGLARFGPEAVASPAEDARRLGETARRGGVAQMCLLSLHAPRPHGPAPRERRAAKGRPADGGGCAVVAVL